MRRGMKWGIEMDGGGDWRTGPDENGASTFRASAFIIHFKRAQSVNE